MKINIAGIERHSFVNGPGTRYVIFVQGCPHHCKGCQNPDTWDSRKGTTYDTENIILDILSTKFLDGVTFSGGDPLFQAEACAEIAERLKKEGINIWCYTGWTFETILAGKVSSSALRLLQSIDVLIDGPFVEALRSDDCLYRGSTNQRLIDVRKSLEENRVREVSSVAYGL